MLGFDLRFHDDFSFTIIVNVPFIVVTVLDNTDVMASLENSVMVDNTKQVIHIVFIHRSVQRIINGILIRRRLITDVFSQV